MESLEAKGKSVDEAIFNGLNEMGLGIDEVEIEIVHEGNKGLFGIGKSALVRLTKKSEEEIRQQEAQIASAVSSSERQERHTRPRGRDRDRDRGRGGRDRDRGDRDREPREYREPREPREPRVIKEIVPGDSPAEVFLNDLFKKMDVEAVAGVTENDEKLMKVEIVGKDTAVLIGRRGDTLDAIQYLTGLVVNKGKDDYLKVMLDAEDYRRKREATLEKLAKRLASNAVKSGKPVTLEPMNPYERRILHATLQSNPRVETYSEGEEPYRRVVIRRKRRED